MNPAFEQETVGDIVATDFRAARVFERFGIDFCCGGRQSFPDACRAAGADPAAVSRELGALPPPEEAEPDGEDVRDWPLPLLVDHIVSTHHAYVRVALPEIAHHLSTLVNVHGERHPELFRVSAAFDVLRHELQQHMMKEERVLFPYICEIALAGGPTHASPFGTIENPIRMMEREHRDAGDELHLIRELTNGFTAPPDGCATYRAAFAELARFERDLHRHVHLENNILFPAAVALEQGT